MIQLKWDTHTMRNFHKNARVQYSWLNPYILIKTCACVWGSMSPGLKSGCYWDNLKIPNWSVHVPPTHTFLMSSSVEKWRSKYLLPNDTSSQGLWIFHKETKALLSDSVFIGMVLFFNKSLPMRFVQNERSCLDKGPLIWHQSHPSELGAGSWLKLNFPYYLRQWQQRSVLSILVEEAPGMKHLGDLFMKTST